MNSPVTAASHPEKLPFRVRRSLTHLSEENVMITLLPGNPSGFARVFRPHLPRQVQIGLVLALLCSLTAISARAQANANPPTKLTYQGFLTDLNGVPLGKDNPVNKPVIFRIFDALTSGKILWSSQQTVTIDKGHFSVLLGEGSAVTSEPFTADLTGLFTTNNPSERYLEISVDGSPILPRQQFLPAPYAMLARKAIELAGGSAVAGNLSVVGALSSSSDLAAGGNANVTSNLTVNGTLTVNNTATLNSLTVPNGAAMGGKLTISGNNVVEFGAGLTKQGDNGKIGYQTFTSDSLDIVGAGPTFNSRKIKLFAEGGGVTVTGPLTVTSPNTISGYGTIPLGGIIMWSGASSSAIPDGWALCDGTVANGYTTPDLRSRFIVGAGSGTGPGVSTSYAIGDKGGEEKHTLTVNEIPSHQHQVKVKLAGYDTSYNNAPEVTRAPDNKDTRLNTGTQSYYSEFTGGGLAHETRPPYYALAFIMRVK